MKPLLHWQPSSEPTTEPKAARMFRQKKLEKVEKKKKKKKNMHEKKKKKKKF
jgi:hypothetical protein